MTQETGSQFIHERTPQFHASTEVESVVGYLRVGGENIPNSPADKISAYLGFLASADHVNDGVLTGDQSSIDRQIDTHVIDYDDVPQGYFDLQQRIAREQGHGDIDITPQMKDQLVEAVQADQHAGLSKWVEYLGGEDGGYPNWFKHYAWNSMTKLGSFDKEKQAFQKRSRGTTAAYPELNREALAYVYDTLSKAKIEGEDVTGDDEKLRTLVNSANFGKLYTHAILETTPDSPELRGETRGSWTLYQQTSDPRTARRLAGSLQGHGTGWCTAGESTAASQLQGGDFYTYSTRDEDGKDTVPRIAIRMQSGKVAEVRGVNASQELEPVMADIAVERLAGLPGGESYIKKADDMKRLTNIEKKITDNPDVELAANEVRFLYELDRAVEGFGYERDPRIDEIRKLRGERDMPELSRILPESIRQQLETSFTAYQTIMSEISPQKRFGRSREATVTQATFEQLFAGKDKLWKENGTYDHIIERLVKEGVRHTLVPLMPSTVTSESEIMALAEKFGENQPHPTYVYDEMYRKNQYTDKEWSGKSGSQSVDFALMPSGYDPELGRRPAAEQATIWKNMQRDKPHLNYQIPSLRQAVSYWYALRAKGDTLNFDTTYTRHNLDLEAKRFGGGSSVPSSCVSDDGKPLLFRSSASNGGDARLLVG